MRKGIGDSWGVHSRMTAIGIGVALALAGGWSWAGPRAIGFGEALALADAQHPALRAAGSAAEAAKEGTAEARAGWRPHVTGYTAYSSTDNPVGAFGVKLNQGIITQQDFEPARLTEPDGIEDFALGLGFGQVLWDGSLRPSVRAAKAEAEASALRREATREEVLLEAACAYAGVVRAREGLEASASARRAAEASRDAARARFERGTVTRADLLQAEVALSDRRRAEIDAESALALAHRTLAVAVGEPAAEFEPSEGFDALEAMTGGDAAGLDSWTSLALETRPDLRALAKEREAAEARAVAVRAGNRPRLQLDAGYEWHDQGFFDDPQGSYAAGLTLGWNAFDGGATGARYRVARHLSDAVAEGEKAARDRALLEVEEAWRSLGASSRRAALAREAVEAATEARRILGERYAQGLSTASDMLAADAALAGARDDLTEARYAVVLARARLEARAGVLVQRKGGTR